MRCAVQIRWGGSREIWIPALASFREAIREARPPASIGSMSLVVHPWMREPVAGGLSRTSRRWGSVAVAAAVHAAATWPVPSTSQQARVEAAFRPKFGLER